MIALTQEKREELVSRLKIYIRTTETAIKAGLATEEDLFNLEVRKVALASLTAAPSGYRWFHEGSQETRGWYASCYPLDSDYLERCLVDKSIHSHEPLYTAPPVPEIKFPEKPDYSGDFTSFKDPVSAYKDGVVDGHRWYEKALKRLNGWEE